MFESSKLESKCLLAESFLVLKLHAVVYLFSWYI